MPANVRRIIAVDDDARTLRLVRDVLGTENWHVLTFDDPETALSYLTDIGPADLIILDVEMPNVDGFAIARTVRAGHHQIPILALTGSAEPDIAVRILAAGADAYLSKSVDIADLRSVARSLLERQAS